MHLLLPSLALELVWDQNASTAIHCPNSPVRLNFHFIKTTAPDAAAACASLNAEGKYSRLGSGVERHLGRRSARRGEWVAWSSRQPRSAPQPPAAGCTPSPTSAAARPRSAPATVHTAHITVCTMGRDALQSRERPNNGKRAPQGGSLRKNVRCCLFLNVFPTEAVRLSRFYRTT